MLYFECGVCGEKRQHALHVYELYWLEAYNIPACRTCLRLNCDGWSPSLERPLLAYLRANNLPEPRRLSNGMLPTDPPKHW